MTVELLRLVTPAREYLDPFIVALKQGWSPQTSRDVSASYLAAIEADGDAFLADLVSSEGLIEQPDGTMRPRLPQIVRWMWDGEFVGSINLRWQPGGDELPPHVSGHVGYAVVPWKRGRGHATAALRLLLPEARMVGLTAIEITTNADNVASQKVIERCGGVLVGTRDDLFTGLSKHVYRIGLGS